MGPKQIVPLPVKVDLGVMVMNRYSTLPKSLEMEPHHQMHFIVKSNTNLEGILSF